MVAEYVNADVANVVLLENASAAINAILRSILFKPGDIMIMFSTAYGPFKEFYKYLNAALGVQIVEVPIVFPLQVSVLACLHPGSAGIFMMTAFVTSWYSHLV